LNKISPLVCSPTVYISPKRHKERSSLPPPIDILFTDLHRHHISQSTFKTKQFEFLLIQIIPTIFTMQFLSSIALFAAVVAAAAIPHSPSISPPSPSHQPQPLTFFRRLQTHGPPANAALLATTARSTEAAGQPAGLASPVGVTPCAMSSAHRKLVCSLSYHPSEHPLLF
jgi:hypothetical protein